MIPLEVVLELLDQLRAEAMEAAEFPTEDNRNAFGFGRAAGMLAVTRSFRERLDNYIEELNRRERQTERA